MESFEEIHPENPIEQEFTKIAEEIIEKPDNHEHLLKLLQGKFITKEVWARLGGEQANLLVKSTFACIVRHSAFEDTYAYLNSIASNYTKFDDLMEAVHDKERLSKALKFWEIASSMRTWLIEKKKNIDEALEKEMKNDQIVDAEAKSKEVIEKIIQQLISKARFIVSLNPAILSEEEDVSLEKNMSEMSSEWKQVMSKMNKESSKAHISAKEKHIFDSLMNTIIITLQTSLPPKRILNRMRINCVKAKSREIGIIKIKEIFESVDETEITADILSWFCTSLRGTDEKVSHYLDQIYGAGYLMEARIRNRFHEAINLFIKKMMNIDNQNELKSYLETLLWRYSSKDQKFIIDSEVLPILWGNFNQKIKEAWGSSIKFKNKNEEVLKIPQTYIHLSQHILAIFEIIVNSCIEKSIVSIKAPESVKTIELTKKVSSINENDSENLLYIIFELLFTELDKVNSSYMNARGVNYKLLKRYISIEKEKEEQKKAKQANQPLPNLATGGVAAATTFNNNATDEMNVNDSYIEDESEDINPENYPEEEYHENEEEVEEEADGLFGGMENRMPRGYSSRPIRSIRAVRGTGETRQFINPENLDDNPLNFQTVFNNSRQVNSNINFGSIGILPLLRDNQTGVSSKNEKTKASKSHKRQENGTFKVNELDLIDSVIGFMQRNGHNSFGFYSEDEIREALVSQYKMVYDSSFLKRILTIILKCSIQENKKIVYNLANSFNIMQLLKLMRLCSTDNKILVAKIIQSLVCRIPLEVIVDACSELAIEHNNDKFFYLYQKAHDKCDKDISVFVEYLVLSIEDVQSYLWNSESSHGSYIALEQELTKIFVELSILKGNESLISKYISKYHNESNENRKLALSSLLGAQYHGMSVGSEVVISTSHHAAGTIDFSFVKQDEANIVLKGSIVGFLHESSKDPKATVQEKIQEILLLPRTIESKPLVILHDSFKKDTFELSKMAYNTYSQHQIKLQKLKVSEAMLHETVIKQLFHHVSQTLTLPTIQTSLSQLGSKRLLSAILNQDFLEKNLTELTGLISDIYRNCLQDGKTTFGFENETFLNLFLLEEKCFRIKSYVSQSNLNLSELSKVTVTYKKPNLIVFKFIEEDIFSFVYNVISISHDSYLKHWNKNSVFTDDKSEVSSSKICYCNSEEINDAVKKGFKFVITTYSPENKPVLVSDKVTIVNMKKADFEEITNLVKKANSGLSIAQEVNKNSVQVSKESELNDFQNQLLHFGFKKEDILDEVKQLKEDDNNEKLLFNLLERNKRKQNEDEDEENALKEQHNEDIEENDLLHFVVESEKINKCFECKDEQKDKTGAFAEIQFNEESEQSGLNIEFKDLIKRISVFRSRRIVLNIIHAVIQSGDENLINSIIQDKAELINLLKLLVHEGLFENSSNQGSSLLIKIKETLILIITSTVPSIQDLAKLLVKDVNSEITEILNKKELIYSFITHEEEQLIRKPMLFFTIWVLMIVNEKKQVDFDFLFLLNSLSGIVVKLKKCTEMRWFLLETLIQLIHKIYQNISDDITYLKQVSPNGESIKYLRNIKLLRKYLNESILIEPVQELSKRTQMIVEFLIKIEMVEEKLVNYFHVKYENEDAQLTVKDDRIEKFATTTKMIENLFENNYVKYLHWIKAVPSIIENTKVTLQSNHLYPKAIHTTLISIPNASSLEVAISQESLVDAGDSIIFTADKQGHVPLQSYSSRVNDRVFQINRKTAYLHFPAKPNYENFGFGSNNFTKLGISSSNDIYSPKSLEGINSLMVKDIAMGISYTIVLTHSGEIFSSGNGRQSGLDTQSKAFVKAGIFHNSPIVSNTFFINVWCYSSSVILQTTDNKLFSIGENNFGQIGGNNSTSFLELFNLSLTTNLKKVALGPTHTLYLTSENVLYHTGSNDYWQNSSTNTTRNCNTTKVNVDKFLRIEDVAVGYYYSVFIVYNKTTKKRLLYKAGRIYATSYYMGGDNNFTILNLSSPDDEPAQVFCYNTFCACITKKGKLFMWGQNTEGQLGLGHNENSDLPQEVTYFSNKLVEQVSLGNNYTLVVASDESNKKSVYAFGITSSGCLGEVVTQKKGTTSSTSTPIKVSFFEDKIPKIIKAGERTSIVVCEGQNIEDLRDNHEVTCTSCDKSPVLKSLFIDLENPSNQRCFDCQIITETQGKKPTLCLRNPVENEKILKAVSVYSSSLKPLGNEGNLVCKGCSEVLKSSFYIFLRYNEKNFICHSCLDSFSPCLESAKVFLRADQDFDGLQLLDSENYFTNSFSYGYKLTVTPNFNEKGSAALIEENRSSFDSFFQEIQFENQAEVYEQFVDLLNDYASKEGVKLLKLQEKNLDLSKSNFSIRSQLIGISRDNLKKMFSVLQVFNTQVVNIINFIDFSAGISSNNRLSDFFKKMTPFIFYEIKSEMIKLYLSKSARDFQVNELKFNRNKVRKFVDKGVCDYNGESTMFGLMYQYLKNMSTDVFKKKEGGNNAKMFNAGFVGEASIDVGGPFREALSQAWSEMQSPILPLLIPSPNQKHNQGLFREKWIINPSAKTTVHLDMFRILGCFIGFAIRTEEFLNLDLPSIFWKKLLGIQPERKDLENIDKFVIQSLENIAGISNNDITEENFDFAIDQSFTCQLSDGSEVEVKEGGSKEKVIFKTRSKYCELVEKTRLSESDLQYASIIKGIKYIFN